MELTFRFAQEADTPLILRFIRDLAEYEHMADQVVADEATLKEQLFDRRGAEVLFALENGKEVGFALFFHNFSTFLGRAGLYLEDLYVLPEHRGKGYGKAIFRRLASIARQRGCGRMEWWCLDWNAPQHRLLPLPERPAHGRVDGIPPHRRGSGAPGGAGKRRGLIKQRCPRNHVGSGGVFYVCRAIVETVSSARWR